MTMRIDKKALEAAIKEAQSPKMLGKKITIYSEPGVRILRYLDLTTPLFSRSKAASDLITAQMQDEYPELWEKITDAIPPRRDEEEETEPFWTTVEGFTNDIKMAQAEEELQQISGKVVTIYNPRISAVLRYLARTVPRISMSKEGSEILQKSMAERLPDMWAKSLELSEG